MVMPVPNTICMQCGRVQATRRATCAQCQAAGPSPLQRVRAAALHTSPLREWIHLLKYEDRPDLAPDLARYLVAALTLVRGAPLADAPVLYRDRDCDSDSWLLRHTGNVFQLLLFTPSPDTLDDATRTAIAALAGVLAVVAWNMAEKRELVTLVTASRGDALVLSLIPI